MMEIHEFDEKCQTVKTDEARIAETMIEGSGVRMTLGLSCGHGGYRNSLVDGSLVFEVTCMPITQVTVVDIDLNNPETWKYEEIVELANFPALTKTTLGTDRKMVRPDAYVVTGRGIQLVFLQPDVTHPLQDSAYHDIAYNKRFWFGMRTHNKQPEEAISPLAPPGSQRVMQALTPAGKVLADAWNKMVNLAEKVRAKRIAMGFERVDDGVCVPDEALPELRTAIE